MMCHSFRHWLLTGLKVPRGGIRKILERNRSRRALPIRALHGISMLNFLCV
jgi:hypothetical protein